MPPTLLSLPTEVKARVVELVPQQDQNRLERTDCDGTDERLEERQEETTGLEMLARVCKELHDLAARRLFEVSVRSFELSVARG